MTPPPRRQAARKAASRFCRCFFKQKVLCEGAEQKCGRNAHRSRKRVILIGRTHTGCTVYIAAQKGGLVSTHGPSPAQVPSCHILPVLVLLHVWTNARNFFVDQKNSKIMISSPAIKSGCTRRTGTDSAPTKTARGSPGTSNARAALGLFATVAKQLALQYVLTTVAGATISRFDLHAEDLVQERYNEVYAKDSTVRLVTRFPQSHAPCPIPYTLYPIPYTLYPTSYTLYPIPYTLYPIPYTLYPIP